MSRQGFITTVFALSLLVLTNLSAAKSPDIHAQNIPKFSPDRVLVKFMPGTAASEIGKAHRSANGLVLKTIPAIGVQVVAIPANTVLEKVALYRKNPNVRFAEPNYYRLLIFPNEGGEPVPPDGIGDYWKEQYGLHNTEQPFSYGVDPITGELIIPALTGHEGADIDAPLGWNSFLSACPDETTCPPSKIAILDSGVDCSHPDLNCADDFNVVDDLVEGDPAIPDGDLIGHGTHVAGIAAALSNNGVGIAGVAWGSLMGSFKVCYAVQVGFSIVGLCDTAAAAQAIIDATNLGYTVINMSYGGPDLSDAELFAINYATSNGVVLVSSAGNDYRKDGCSYPAAHADVIAVGATDWYDNLASFSNFGDCVSVLAPGSEIFSTFPGDCYGEECYTWISGTSMASPHVAGVAALLKTLLGGSADSSGIRNIIEISADQTGALDQNFLGWSQNGRLNLASAMTEATGTPPPPPPDPTNAMFVSDIRMTQKGPNLNITVTIRRDSNGNGAAEGNDATVAGAILSVELCPTSSSTTCNFRTTASVTNNKGQVNYKALNPSGNYRFEVLGIAHDTYNYDTGSNLDGENNPVFYP